MSIGLANRIKELEAEVARNALSMRESAETLNAAIRQIAALHERIQALENRPKPGRPPKNG